jgi:hypothetical protein
LQKESLRLLARAGALQRRGENAAALNVISQLCAATPVDGCRFVRQNGVVALLTARILSARGRYGAAAALLETVLKSNHRTSMLLEDHLRLELATVLLHAAKPKKAAAALWAVRKRKNGYLWWNALIRQAQAFKRAGMRRGQAAAYRELADLSIYKDLWTRFRYAQAEALLPDRRFAKAVAALRKAAIKGAGSFWDGRIVAKLRVLRNKRGAKEVAPFTPKEKIERCRGLLRSYQAEQAALELEQLLGSNEISKAQKKVLRVEYAKALLWAGQYEKGLTVVQKIARDPRRRAKARTLQRRFWKRLGRFDRVAAALETRASRLEGRQRQPAVERAAWARVEAGHYRRAHTLYRQHKGGVGGRRDRFRRAYVLLKVGRPKQAVRALSPLVAKRDLRARYWSAVARWRAGARNEALDRLRALVRQAGSTYYGAWARLRLRRDGVHHGVWRHPVVPAPVRRFKPTLERVPLSAVRGLLAHWRATPKRHSFVGKVALLALIGFQKEARQALRWHLSCLQPVALRLRKRRPLTRISAWTGRPCAPNAHGGLAALGCGLLRRLAVLAWWMGEQRLWRMLVRHCTMPKKELATPCSRAVRREAAHHGLRPAWIWAVMKVESAFDPLAVSWVGARGLMQLMPHTARKIAARLARPNFDSSRLAERQSNIHFGSWYLGQLYEKFRGQLVLALAGYNGGPHNVAVWLKIKPNVPLDELIEEIPFTETRRYVKKVLRWILRYSIHTGDETRDLLRLRVDPRIGKNIDF